MRARIPIILAALVAAGLTPVAASAASTVPSGSTVQPGSTGQPSSTVAVRPARSDPTAPGDYFVQRGYIYVASAVRGTGNLRRPGVLVRAAAGPGRRRAGELGGALPLRLGRPGKTTPPPTRSRSPSRRKPTGDRDPTTTATGSRWTVQQLMRQIVANGIPALSEAGWNDLFPGGDPGRLCRRAERLLPSSADCPGHRGRAGHRPATRRSSARGRTGRTSTATCWRTSAWNGSTRGSRASAPAWPAPPRRCNIFENTASQWGGHGRLAAVGGRVGLLPGRGRHARRRPCHLRREPPRSRGLRPPRPTR